MERLRAVRLVRQLSVEEPLGARNTQFVKHAPWNTGGEDPEADGELPETPPRPSSTGSAAAGSVDPTRLIVENVKEVASREF